MSKTFSGKYIVKILLKYFECIEISQKGSHLKIHSNSSNKNTIVPMHTEVATGTLKGLLKMIDIEYEDFLRHAKRK